MLSSALEFARGPASSARPPTSLPASSRESSFARGSSPQTSASSSGRSCAARSIAETDCRPEATGASIVTASSSASERSPRGGRTPWSVKTMSLATQSTGVAPISSFSSRAVSITAFDLTARMTRSAPSTTSALLPPRTPSSTPRSQPRWRSREPTATSKSRSRRRAASARPKAPVPPTIATFNADPLRSGWWTSQTAGLKRPQRQSRYGLQVGIASDASSGRDEAEDGLDESAPCLGLGHQRAGDERLHTAFHNRFGIVSIGLVQDERTDQALVTARYLAGSRPACEALEHLRGRAFDSAAADQGTDGDDALAPAFQRRSDLADGDDRADADERVARRDRDQLGRFERLDHSRRRPGLSRALVDDLVDAVPVSPGDEPFLELELAGGRPDPGPQPVVGRRQQGQLEPDGPGDLRRRRRQRLAASERLRPGEMEPEVAVSELEPGLAPELLDRVARVPRLVCTPPAALLVAQAGERVEQRVEVGRDVEAVHLQVVADVRDHGNVARRDDLGQRLNEARAADAACQNGDSHLAAKRRLSSAVRVRSPRRPSSGSRSLKVSTSAARFGISTSRDGASARNRSALPGP